MFGAPTVLVAHGMASQRVAMIPHLFQNARVPLRLFTDHKKRGRHAPVVKLFQHPRCEHRIGAIVEGEVNGIRVGCGPQGARPPRLQQRVGPSRDAGGPNRP